MSFARAAGILLHPTSLPSRGGIGDFGPAAYRFVDFLASARQGVWQVLPLGPLGYGNSPYSSTSAFAGNPLLISLERLAEHGWLDRYKLAALANNVGSLDYDEFRQETRPLRTRAAERFLEGASPSHRSRFERFCKDSDWCREDFVLFDGLRDHHEAESWNKWPRELARREEPALEQARRDLAEELNLKRII